MAFISKSERFMVESHLLFTNGDEVDCSEMTTMVNIKDSFIANAFPLFVVLLKVPENVANQIRDDDSVKLSLKIYSLNMTDTNSETDSDDSEMVPETLILETILRIMIKPYVTQSTTVDTENEVATEDDTDGNQVTLPIFDVSLSGIPDDLLKNNEHVVNEIIDFAIPADAALYVISNYTNTKSIYMQPPDNKITESQILIPPLNVVPCIKYLQTRYGIYNRGLNLYFGTDGTYICSLLKSKETPDNYLNVKILPSSEVSKLEDYSVVKCDSEDETNFELTLQNAPAFSSSKKIINDQVGKLTIFNSYDYSFDIVSREYSNDDAVETDKVRYFWNDQAEVFPEMTEYETTKATQEATAVVIKNVNPFLFGMATKVIFSSAYEYINGEYSIVGRITSFASVNRRQFTSACNLMLGKI